MGKNEKKFQKFVIHVSEKLAMTPKLGLKMGNSSKKWAKKIGNHSTTSTKKEAMNPELGHINRAITPEFG